MSADDKMTQALEMISSIADPCSLCTGDEYKRRARKAVALLSDIRSHQPSGLFGLSSLDRTIAEAKASRMEAEYAAAQNQRRYDEEVAKFKAKQPSGAEWVMPEPAGAVEIDCGPAPGGGRELMYVDGFTAAQVQAAHSAGLAARIPAGFWLAPLELSEPMQIAGALAHQRSVCHDFIGPIDDAWTAMRQAHITATEAPAKGGE